MAEDISNAKKSEIIEGEVIELEPQENVLEDIITEQAPLESGISKYYSFDKGLFKIKINDYLNFDFGAIGNMSWNVDNKKQDLHSKFNFPTTDFVLSGKANEYIDYKAQMFAHRNIEERTILGDLWVRGKYKNYTIQAGRMRKPFAYEPTFSSYDLDFAYKSQIADLFSDHRDSGGKIVADYKYGDIALGLYSVMQDQPFDFHNHGIEFNTTVGIKPLANFKDKGDLRIAGSIATGNRDYSYNHYGALIKYNYQKWGIKSEYIRKEAIYYGEKTADGFYIDGTYFITDKLQGLVRFDSFNPDSKNHSDRDNEYTAGLNYYLNNRNTMFVLNYTFADADVDSHRVALQMRYKTW